MECQLKHPSPQNKVCGLLTNKAMSDHQALVVVGHTVEFEPANYSDPKQLWTKLYLKDGQGNLVFMLVNGANVIEDGKAVKALQHSLEPNKPVRVVDLKFDPSNIMKDDPTLLWTDNDGGNGFMVIRESKNKDALALDAQNSKLVVAAKYKGGDSQLWMFMPQPKV